MAELRDVREEKDNLLACESAGGEREMFRKLEESGTGVDSLSSTAVPRVRESPLDMTALSDALEIRSPAGGVCKGALLVDGGMEKLALSIAPLLVSLTERPFLDDVEAEERL